MKNLVLIALAVGMVSSPASALHPKEVGVSDDCLGQFKDSDLEWVQASKAGPLIRKYEGNLIYTELRLAGAPYDTNFTVSASDEKGNTFAPFTSFAFDFIAEGWMNLTGGDPNLLYHAGAVGRVINGRFRVFHVCAFTKSGTVSGFSGMAW